MLDARGRGGSWLVPVTVPIKLYKWEQLLGLACGDLYIWTGELHVIRKCHGRTTTTFVHVSKTFPATI